MSGLIIGGRAAKIVVRGNGKGMLAVLDSRNNVTALLERVPAEYDRIVIATDNGYMSAHAMAWLAETGIPWVWLWRDKIVATSHPGQEPEMWRKQGNSDPLPVMRYILAAKLDGQHMIADMLNNPDAGKMIRSCADAIRLADSRKVIMGYEGRAALAYWEAWDDVYVPFLADHLSKVPPRWYSWNGRRSLVAEAINRHASDPINAMLNYAYKVGETLCVQACYATDLSPNVSVMHHRKYLKSRDGNQLRNSMALDLLEVLRPWCDRAILGMLDYGQGIVPYLRWSDFLELANGTVRVENTELRRRIIESVSEFQDKATEAAEEVRRILA